MEKAINLVMDNDVSDLPKVWEDIPGCDLGNMIRDLELVAVKASRMAAYLETMSDAHDHIRAVGVQNKVAEKIRKIQGYTMAHQINF